MDTPNFLVRLLHSVPHVNITLHRVNDTFNPHSKVYMASLGILASIPAAFLILSLVGLLLYLLTRCCDRKPRKAKSQTCQNCVLISTTLLCCAAIGLGLYGNDDFHNGLLQTFNSGREIKGLVLNFTNKTERLKQDIRAKVLMSDLDDILDKPAINRTAVDILQDNVRLVRENTTKAVSELEAVLYSMRPNEREDSLKYYLKLTEFYESIRWPTTLGFLTVLLLLCAILVIGVARRSRCALIFFSVLGLFGVILCWLLSGIYLASSVALGDFCMQPTEIICRQVATRPDHMNYLNCGTKRISITKRLNESRDYLESARDIFKIVSRMSKDAFPRISFGKTIDQISREFDDSREQLSDLTIMLDARTIERKYGAAIKGVCGGGLLGLSLMTIATLITALLFTILVCVDSHTWIYLRKRRPYIHKSEITPFLSTTTTTTTSPTAPINSGTSTINRTLLHHQQQNQSSTLNITNPSNSSVGMGSVGGAARNGGTSSIRGLAFNGGDSPPPDYNYVVHDNRLSGHHTLGRLPSQQHVHGNYLVGPNNGKYATLSKQCKTLESNDFY